MRRFDKRKTNRNSIKIQQDVENTGKLVREDVYDVISPYKVKSEAETELRRFLGKLPDKIIAYQGDRLTGIARVISDMNSYGVKWEA